jgi:hypothetical protein
MNLRISILIISTLMLSWQGLDMLPENSLPAEETKKEACIHILTQQKKYHPKKPGLIRSYFVSAIPPVSLQFLTVNHQPVERFMLQRALLL